MTKTFITVIPFQPEGRLTPVAYAAHGNTKLEYGEETRFPIIPMISGYAEKSERIRIIAILTDGDNFKHNYENYFVPEINALVKRNGYIIEGIKVIPTPDSEDIDVQLRLFSDIISAIGDDEELYTCITYGTKPTPIVQFMALNYAYKLKKNASVGCVAYGRFLHNDMDGHGIGRIYDQTAMFYMNSIVNKLAEHGASNPERAIRIMLGLENAEGSDDD